ncbi:hypothetical protein HF086_002877 [Spodoptera exigua]|uniref:Uncharacterized protein n=1 Tax=Spodoptera exigua TaxID=7107 RepID=A0A922M9C8_SPOEX|nr:hypothetical protein HF086_002877 [Spodoptera exigua]
MVPPKGVREETKTKPQKKTVNQVQQFLMCQINLTYVFEPVAGPSRIPLREHNANITPTKSEFFVSSKQEGDQKSKMLIRKLKNMKEILNTKISATFALLLQGELQNYKRKKAGRRWNMEAKIQKVTNMLHIVEENDLFTSTQHIKIPLKQIYHECGDTQNTT